MDKFVIPAENAGNPTPFDVYRQEREDGSEYWSARDLAPVSYTHLTLPTTPYV